MKCKLIKPLDPSSSFRVNEIYIYKIKPPLEFYNYYVYEINNGVAGRNSGQFSERYFKYHFIDIQGERKQKLEKLNEIHSH